LTHPDTTPENQRGVNLPEKKIWGVEEKEHPRKWEKDHGQK